MKVFITGGTGFIGNQVVRMLLERGDEVRALVRSQEAAEKLRSQGAIPFLGDITQRETMLPGMQGCELVFHIAAWYKLGARDQSLAETINVEGTRNVIELAWQLGVPRIVYTSTVAVFGDTRGVVADETYCMPEELLRQGFLTEYDRTKWLAHYQVVLPLIERGAPVIILMPGAVYGPGDRSLVGQMMTAFYRGLFVAFPGPEHHARSAKTPAADGPETVLSFSHVEDIARAHLAAAERGRPGESYIITGPYLPMGQMVRLWAHLTGKPAPLFYIPANWLKPLLPLAKLLGTYLDMPEMVSADGINILGATYMAQAGKAASEWGWNARPLEDGMQDAFNYIAQNQRPWLSAAQKRVLAAAALGAGAGMLFAWLLRHKGKRS